MKKSEILAASNDELIAALVTLGMRSAIKERVLKADEREARQICTELERRGVIENGNALFDRWLNF